MEIKNIENIEKESIKSSENKKIIEINPESKVRWESFDNISKFILSNYKFWNEVSETMVLMNDIANSLNIKVKKVK